jgi:hypothetical protein
MTEFSREERIINSNNIDSFYKYVNKNLSRQSGVGPLKDDSGQLITDDYERANLLNNYFASVFTCDNNSCPPFARRVPVDVEFSNIEINEDIVLKSINKLKSGLSCGPDCIPSFFIKKLSYQLAGPLSNLFKHFVQNGSIPSVWKHANVTPFFQKRYLFRPQ